MPRAGLEEETILAVDWSLLWKVPSHQTPLWSLQNSVSVMGPKSRQALNYKIVSCLTEITHTVTVEAM